MIRTLSPYWVETPYVSPASGETAPSYTLQLFIWDGLKASPPASPQYEITKVNYENSLGNGRLEISKRINDYIDFLVPNFDYTPTDPIEYYDSTNNVWVKWQILYNTDDPLDASAQSAVTKLATKGWSYGFEGENVDNVKTIDNAQMKVPNGGFAIFPVYRDESTTTTFTVISYPSNEINESETLTATTDSSELITYALIDCTLSNDTYIEVKRNSTTLGTVFPINECEYTPYTILFQNRYGAVETLTFFKERRDSVSFTSDSYESISGQPKEGYHQYKQYNINGKRGISLSTGFIYESNNDKMDQLMLSERIWLYEGLNPLTKAVNVETPVIIKSSSLEYLTKINDKLVNYTLEFEYAFNLINNI